MKRTAIAALFLTSIIFALPPLKVAKAVADPTTVNSAPVTTTTLVPASVMAQWGKVAWCEHHGNWTYPGATFDGGLGIARWNWVHYGGLEFASAPHLATPEQQVIIAQRIQGTSYVPDQDGRCRGW